jgi:hypothetical protein
MAIWSVITCITTCPISTFKPVNNSCTYFCMHGIPREPPKALLVFTLRGSSSIINSFTIAHTMHLFVMCCFGLELFENVLFCNCFNVLWHCCIYQLVSNITFCHITISSVVNIVSSNQVTKSIVFNIFICIVILSHVNLKVENQHYAKKKFMGFEFRAIM